MTVIVIFLNVAVIVLSAVILVLLRDMDTEESARLEIAYCLKRLEREFRTEIRYLKTRVNELEGKK